MTTPLTAAVVAEALLTELTAAVDAAVGGAVAAPAASPASGDGWRLTGAVGGARRGTIRAWFDLGGAETLARRMTGAEAPEQATITALLRDLWAQAGAALGARPEFAGVTLTFGTAEPTGAPDKALVYDLRAGDVTACVAVLAELVTADAWAGPENLDVVLDIDLPLVVRFARTTMSIRSLSTLGPGSIVDMERSPDDPVQILVGDRVIARGEVVVVGGNYGVRITDLTSPAERVRLEA
ncbi:MAG TPA: FliM/FliN family flagellar motor switch protein [Vicinamibacterales bacterium]|nr:FliM/FliN family flagellar motor switch protein [Vicinamibacterales bacterium]